MSLLIWQYITIGLAGLAVVLLFLMAWRRRELRRMRAMDLAREIAPWGFDHLSKLLTAYAIGNYFGADSVTRVTHEIIDELKGGGLPAMLKKIGWKVVEGVFLKNADDRLRLKDLLDAATKFAPKTELDPPPPAV